jgi:tetratricopeptide (TPR) repeat protein
VGTGALGQARGQGEVEPADSSPIPVRHKSTRPQRRSNKPGKLKLAEGDGATTRGWLAAVDGELRARSGNAKGCLAALDAAERSLQGIENGDSRPWVGIGAFDTAKLKGYYGLCYLQLRRPQDAVTELTGALDALDPALRKHRCTALADLASALIDLGEIEEGCRRASQALRLAIDLRHAVGVDRIRDLDQRLAPWGDAAAVREFREQLIEQLLLAFHQSTLPTAW